MGMQGAECRLSHRALRHSWPRRVTLARAFSVIGSLMRGAMFKKFHPRSLLDSLTSSIISHHLSERAPLQELTKDESLASSLSLQVQLEYLLIAPSKESHFSTVTLIDALDRCSQGPTLPFSRFLHPHLPEFHQFNSSSPTAEIITLNPTFRLVDSTRLRTQGQAASLSQRCGGQDQTLCRNGATQRGELL